MEINTLSSHVGLFLRMARKDKNLTGRELAKLMNISQQQISRYERGVNSLRLGLLEQYLIVLDKNWRELFKYIESGSKIKHKNIYDD
ncbi:helix-turn-helix domain-containing protein [Providencia rettgeri]